MGLTTAEEKAWIEHIKAKKQRKEPLTSQEERIWGYSQYGSGAPMGSGGCAPYASRPTDISGLVEPLGEN